ncbi:hypothetical protein [Hydrogenophaga sp.]|uniref:hypothetical protein n=1 Tax=Hydrogenophaga sp. TaxID=1904254 RepID=UPI0035AE3285
MKAWRPRVRRLLAVSLTCMALMGLSLAQTASVPDLHPLTLAPNGLWWDPSEQQLYLTDDVGNRLVVWRDGALTGRSLTLPPAPASGAGLGQLAREPGGRWWVTRFGFGKDGSVLTISPDGAPLALSGLSPQRRRIAVQVVDAGRVLIGWFVKDIAGGVSLLTLGKDGQATEADVVEGLVKPAGVVLAGDHLLVADQGTGRLLSFPWRPQTSGRPQDASAGRVVARWDPDAGIDLMVADSRGTLYIGARAGFLDAVSSTGEVRRLVSGLQPLRGVALDEAGRRLMVVELGRPTGHGPALRVLPLD